jgi:hypothetical protein
MMPAMGNRHMTGPALFLTLVLGGCDYSPPPVATATAAPAAPVEPPAPPPEPLAKVCVTDKLVFLEGTPAQYEAAFRQKCQVGDLVTGSFNIRDGSGEVRYQAVSRLCDLSKQVVMWSNVFTCYLAPKREVY